METRQVWKNCLSEARSTLDRFLEDPEQLAKCVSFSEKLAATVKNGGNLFACGNGGSHCDSMHFAEELTGRYQKNRRPVGALALGDPSHMTCVANDFGFEHIFARQLDGLGRTGDLLIGISTSGNSQNVINAFHVARDKGIYCVGLLGKDGGKLKDLADLSIIVPAQTADRIQEMHIKLLHTVIETMEREVFPENYNNP